VLFLILLAALDAQSQRWNAPVAPFRIAGNVYYVGAAEVSSFLIATPRGLIVLDGGFEETAPMIEAKTRDGGRTYDVVFVGSLSVPPEYRAEAENR
jgi:hypothetical protein